MAVTASYSLIYLVFGIVIGILAMAFLFVLGGVHRSFHEIEWHDAQKEKPSLYINEQGEPRFVRVLIATKKGIIIDSVYYPDFNQYDHEWRENITHFAYIEELKSTIPPCPVCRGDILNNPFYAYPGNP